MAFVRKLIPNMVPKEVGNITMYFRCPSYLPTFIDTPFATPIRGRVEESITLILTFVGIAFKLIL